MNTNHWFRVLAQKSLEASPLEQQMILDKHKRITPNNDKTRLWRNVDPTAKLKPKKRGPASMKPRKENAR